MNPKILIKSTIVFFGSAFLYAASALTNGAAAPDFQLTDLSGKSIKLSDFKGKTIVLEWHNPNCPFVVKHYNSGNIPGMHKAITNDVVWLAINSTNPAHQDHMSTTGLSDYLRQKQAQPTAYLLDTKGTVGKQYEAKTTPHMYIINASGQLVYQGGIDSIRSANISDIDKATNYVKTALTEMKAGKPISTPTSTPYGCSIKYEK
jgi:glutathione peroxidase-family protein